jgi:23S rRNA (cytosine1962-C5)-methyltransferase
MARTDEPYKKGRSGSKSPRFTPGIGEKSHNPTPPGKRVPGETGVDTSGRLLAPNRQKKAVAGLKGGESSPSRAPERQVAHGRTTLPGAVISRRASDSIRSGHVWVFATEIETVELGAGEQPALLPVADNRGILLGTALYSPASQIALRMVSREAISESQWLELLAMRLRAAIARRAPQLDAENTACRLCFSEADELPGLIADQYGDLAVLQLLTKGLDNEAVRETCVHVLREDLGAKRGTAKRSGGIDRHPVVTIIERPDPRIRELEGLPAPAPGPLWAADAKSPKTQTQFLINGLKFFYDTNSGQKTGAFLDQRMNYAAATEWAKRLGATGRALDVCTYQGGFALHLARVSTSVTGIDASHSSLEVAEQNLEANRAQLNAEVDWVEGDAFEILRDWCAAGKQFDTIVLDPPAFAKSKRAVEGALRGYKELNLRALKMLRPGGLLLTCSCSHHVSWADLEGALAAAAADAGTRVRLIERRGAALDHPVVLNLPETEYLKCLVVTRD